MKQHPLPLPTYTFILGDDPLRNDLATLIAERDRGMLPDDFEEPLRTMTMEVFAGGFQMDFDLSKPVLPGFSTTGHQWIDFQRTSLQSIFGKDALAHLAIARCLDTHIAVDRYIFRDTHNLDEIRAFVRRFGAANCAVILVGSVNKVDSPLGLPVYDLSLHPTTDARILALEVMMGLMPVAGASF